MNRTVLRIALPWTLVALTALTGARVLADEGGLDFHATDNGFVVSTEDKGSGAGPHGAHGAVTVVATSDDDDESKPTLSPDLVAKLSPEQVVQVLHDRAEHEVAIERERARAEANNPADTVAPIGGMLMVFGVVAALAYASYRKQRLVHETVRTYLERGQDVPPELFYGGKKPTSDLRRGVLLCAIGLGLGLALLAGGGPWGIGVVPLMLGCGYLATWYLENARGLRI
jgi:hypothetical protein